MNIRIAILDDNIADRRYAEKLLLRETARLHSLHEEGYQVDCLGSVQKLLHMPETYEIFMIDYRGANEDTSEGSPAENLMNSEKDDSTIPAGTHAIIRELRRRGIAQPVILCPEKAPSLKGAHPLPSSGTCAGNESDKAFAEEMGNLFFLEKPHTAESLLPVIRECAGHIVHQKGRIVLRTDGETLYVTGEEILYAAAEEAGFVAVTLRDRGSIRIRNDIPSLYAYICSLDEDELLVPISSKAFINSNALQKKSFLSVLMCDGKKLRVSPSFAGNLK